MGFWEEHEERESALQAEATLKARHPQDAPTECAACGVVAVDVLLGYCPSCA